MDIKKQYKEIVVPEMKKGLKLNNNFEVPKIKKVVVNVGIGKYLKDDNAVKEIQESMKMIVGQKPVLTKSRKSIAGFKIREGLEVGVKATLRGKRMWDFLNRLVGAAIPRTRDFHGLKETSIDNAGNLNIGIKEHLIFPEILPEKVKTNFGMQITVVTDSRDRKSGMELFKLLRFPIEKAE